MRFMTHKLCLTFTNIGLPTESLLLASLLVKQQINLVWPNCMHGLSSSRLNFNGYSIVGIRIQHSINGDQFFSIYRLDLAGAMSATL